jgi:hypothetical protein
MKFFQNFDNLFESLTGVRLRTEKTGMKPAFSMRAAGQGLDSYRICSGCMKFFQNFDNLFESLTGVRLRTEKTGMKPAFSMRAAGQGLEPQ